MSAEPQPPFHKQLFECTAVVLSIINNREPVESVDLGPLTEGLISLQDTLLGSLHISDSMLDPFYLLCLLPCKAFKEQILPGCNISVAGYKLRQLQDVLLALFHALSTYLSIIRCARGQFDGNTKARCMDCLSRAVDDLGKHETHLKGLKSLDLSVLLQITATQTCLLLYKNRLRDFEIGSLPSTSPFCDCISRGSNRTSSSPNDIIIIRLGESAKNRLAEYGELLLQEISQGHARKEDISARYKVVQERFERALKDLRRDEELELYETLTRGYRLDFTLPYAEMMHPDL
ncbi:uncharacterized protein ACHE_10987A [Aspergillus chevalieri]|uniref:Uncharacterized protein n=1 Tax=Aspergillus chevalieri TaxID=182096 RepID=A0A7R7ZIF0_ASPCH|nr:uncharacterized protein ACHE_10987A [Aspergillus chevalieri]BCR83585.1 hypothetical protein ACHE_10987A [Aspergillus chevalieri]